jgi:hypothetical protein
VIFETIKCCGSILVRIVTAGVCCFTNSERVNSNTELYKYSVLPLDVVKIHSLNFG